MLLRFAGFELDQLATELRAPDGKPVKLRPKTFEMLRLFAASPGRALSKQELMEAIWPNVIVSEDSLFQCIRELRTALGDNRRQIIKLASGGGYVFTAAPTDAASSDAPVATVAAVAEPASAQRPRFGWRARAVAAGVIALCAVIALALAAPYLFKRSPPVVAVLAIVDASNDPRGASMAAEVTGRLTDGFARIDGISVVTPSAGSSDFEVRGELQRGLQAWTLRARLIKTATGEIQSVVTVSVDIEGLDGQLQQSRLAAGAGHPLARRLNELLDGASPATGGVQTGNARVVIEQALASINQTTRERFAVAQAMLQKALAEEPDNVDIAVALAALQLRGIQMVWYSPDDANAAEAQASAALERALRTKPNSIAVLETFCRFQSATNRFAESLVTCARALSLDPWNGLALYLVGIGEIRLGRFEDALQTFRQADRFDTPQVSRWTWYLGAGWAHILMGNGEQAVPWLERSIAITAASGRTHMLLAASYQQMGRLDEAKAAMREGLKLRPGTTMLNVAPPVQNASPVYLQASDRVIQLMVAAGLPER